MISIFKDKTENGAGHLLNEDNHKNEAKSKVVSKVNINLKRNSEQIPYLLTLSKALLPEQSTFVAKQQQNLQMHSSMGDVGCEEVLVSVQTGQQLEDVVRGYELKVSRSTDHISCLQEHIGLLHDQLMAKNNMIARMCDRYLALAKEKRSSENQLQCRIDELNKVVEACEENNTSKLQKLLIQHINRSRYMENQNKNLRIIILKTKQKFGMPKEIPASIV